MTHKLVSGDLHAGKCGLHAGRHGQASARSCGGAGRGVECVYLNSAISLYAFVFLKCVCVFLSTERTSEVLLLASV